MLLAVACRFAKDHRWGSTCCCRLLPPASQISGVTIGAWFHTDKLAFFRWWLTDFFSRKFEHFSPRFSKPRHSGLLDAEGRMWNSLPSPPPGGVSNAHPPEGPHFFLHIFSHGVRKIRGVSNAQGVEGPHFFAPWRSLDKGGEGSSGCFKVRSG
jgi:hypothetical protein